MIGRFQLPTTGGWHDRDDKVRFRGLVLPGVLLLWAAVNLVTCQAVWPNLRGRAITFVWVTDFFRVSMAAGVKVGIAVACFGWYFMANREEWSYWTQPVTLLGCAAAVVAFVLGSLAFVW